jgi:alpha-1,6-mannosyltransferase
MAKRLILLGVMMLIPYAYALGLKDLRQQTAGFEWAFFIAFTLYAMAVWVVLRGKEATTPSQIVLIFVFGVAFRAILVTSQPKLSDDMYRYVWDGRVQANLINPYLYPPDAPELKSLRDDVIWPLINRKNDVTVYPAGAELAYTAIWHLWPDNVHWFQVVMAAGDLLAGALLVVLLRALGRSPLMALIYLWSPLVIFETAHSAHVDGLVLPFMVGAWLARVKRQDALTGFLLGVATALKLYPVLLLPLLWRMRDPAGRFRPSYSTPLVFAASFLIPYLPYLSASGGVIGYLPNYFKEQFNPGLAYFIGQWVKKTGGEPGQVIFILLLATLIVIYIASILRKNTDGESAIRRCIWPIGAFTLLTQNLFPWYMLWLVPLLAMFLPARTQTENTSLASIPTDSWAGWWLFCGLIALSYTFFIRWRPVPLVAWIQFLPLYTFLFIDLARWLHRRGGIRLRLVSPQGIIGASKAE